MRHVVYPGARVSLLAVGAVIGLLQPCRAEMQEVFCETFSVNPTSRWEFAGVSNSFGQPLFRYNAVSNIVLAEWNQSNRFVAAGDPYTIVPSRFTAPIGRTLTDRETFRAGATLTITPGSVPNTTEFYQIGNFGLYNIAQTGPDRTLADNFTANAVKVKDAGDFIDFTYFINNNSFGFNANITATIGAHITGVNFDYTTGSGTDTGFFHDTDMGTDNYLPQGTNLYVEIRYYGCATDGRARRAYCAIHSDPARTQLVQVNGTGMFYWTQPLDEGKTFSLTDVGFYNYVADNFGGVNGEARGCWDDVFIEVQKPVMTAIRNPGNAVVIKWISVPGKTYQVYTATNLGASAWSNVAAVAAVGKLTCYTNSNPSAAASFFRVSY